jgi:hypothetical protein
MNRRMMYIDDSVKEVHVITKENTHVPMCGEFLKMLPPASPSLLRHDVERLVATLDGEIPVDIEYLNYIFGDWLRNLKSEYSDD